MTNHPLIGMHQSGGWTFGWFSITEGQLEWRESIQQMAWVIPLTNLHSLACCPHFDLSRRRISGKRWMKTAKKKEQEIEEKTMMHSFIFCFSLTRVVPLLPKLSLPSLSRILVTQFTRVTRRLVVGFIQRALTLSAVFVTFHLYFDVSSSSWYFWTLQKNRNRAF